LCHYRGFADAGLLSDLRLYLGGFYPEAANLDLLIHAAQKFDAAVGPPARPVAGAIQARTTNRRKGIGYKAFRRQVR
jgi:hypothetical protein